MSENHDACVYLSFAPTLSLEERADLKSRLDSGDWSVQQGLALQIRSETIPVIVVCLTLVGTGFAQRFGEVAADRVLAAVRTALLWMRSRQVIPLALPMNQSQLETEDQQKPEAKGVEVVDVVDKNSGLVIRLTGAEPDTTLEMLRLLLEHRRGGNDEPVMWDGEDWS